MDRNVIVATILIALIMFVWLWLLAPPPPDPTLQEAPPDETTELDVAPVEPGLPAESPQLRLDEDDALARATEGEERFITVDTDLYRARFSTLGATLVGFELKTYQQFDQVTPVQLVDTTTAGALALAFTTPENHFVDTRALFFDVDFDEETLVVGDTPATLTFEVPIGNGAIRQTYTFQSGEYEVGLRIEKDNVESFVTREGYEVIWDGGIPFSEGDPENEGRSSGAFARSGGQVEKITLDRDLYQEQRLAGNVTWTAVKSKYFTSVLIPSMPTRGAELLGEVVGERATPDYWETYTTRLLIPLPEDDPHEFRLYVGPMEFYRITGYGLGLYDMVDYGWAIFAWMTRPLAMYVFIPVFTLLASFIPNYGVVILLFALLIKIVVYPLTKKSYKSMARMRELQPKMEEIKEKYGDNPQKQQQEMMKMYKETGVNPLGGCIPMLLQYPIIIALWLFLPTSIEIRQQGFLWAPDLSAPDVILNLPFTLPFYGDFVAGFTLLMGISMVIQMKVQMTAAMSGAQAKIFTYVFPIMIFVIFNRLASGLSLYYLAYNIVTAVQQQFINKHIAREKENGEDVRQNGRPAAAKKKKVPAGKGPKSVGRKPKGVRRKT